MITKHTITMEQARRAVAATLAALEPGDKPVAVVVADEHGEPIYAERMDGATANDMRQAERKAYTAAFMELLREAFSLGDGTRVTWGAATIEHHEQRIAMLRAMAAGIEATIGRHEAAVLRLREAGAKCLSDLVARPAA